MTTFPSSCKQSRRDQDVRWTVGHRNVVIR